MTALMFEDLVLISDNLLALLVVMYCLKLMVVVLKDDGKGALIELWLLSIS